MNCLLSGEDQISPGVPEANASRERLSRVPESEIKGPVILKPDKRLKTRYDRYNKAYFDGTLPGDTRITFNEELSHPHYGMTICVEDDDTKHLFFDIHINPCMHGGGEQISLTLLHEMAHIKLYPYSKHGKKFDEEMKRLAMRDAFRGIW